MNNKIANLSDDSFEKDVLCGKGFFLIDFWAEWCGPCKVIAPIMEEVADEFNEKLTIAKLNIEKNPVTTLKYNIRSVPTLLLFRNGEVIATKVGILSKKQLEDFLNANL